MIRDISIYFKALGLMLRIKCIKVLRPYEEKLVAECELRPAPAGPDHPTPGPGHDVPPAQIRLAFLHCCHIQDWRSHVFCSGYNSINIIILFPQETSI